MLLQVLKVACKNSRFSLLFAVGREVSRGGIIPRETSSAAKTEEKRLFLQASRQSWFKLTRATAREFADVACWAASGINSPQLDVGFFFGKSCESQESENFWAICGVRLRMYDTCRWCCSFTDLNNCRLWECFCARLTYYKSFWRVDIKQPWNACVPKTMVPDF